MPAPRATSIAGLASFSSSPWIIAATLAMAPSMSMIAAEMEGPAGTPTQIATGRHGMVVSVARPGSEAGVWAMRQGGNAVDAAVATAFALAVVHPEAGNIGGGGFMLVYPGHGATPVCVDYRETAPARVDRYTFVRDPDALSHRAVGVPGTVRGLELAHRRFGRMPWKRLLEPAIELAAGGFVVDDLLARSLNAALDRAQKFEEFLRVYGPVAGPRWKAGDRLVLPELAQVLRLLADQGADAFYRGQVAEMIVNEMKAGGGFIDREDLANYQAQIRTPVHGTFRGYDVFAPPPPSSGGICLVQMLHMAERLDLGERGPWSPQTAHLVIEAMRRTYCDRARFLGDPDYVEIPAYFGTKEYSARLAETIPLDRASRSGSLADEVPLLAEGNHTTHFSIVDGDGMAVANTYTLEQAFGSMVVVHGGGFLLNNEMGDFNWVPGRTDPDGHIGTEPNLPAPGKRMLSSQTPTIVAKDGRAFLVTGSPGGRTIINTVFCVLLNTLEFGMSVPDAVAAPRWHHQWFPDEVRFECPDDPRFKTLLEALRARGHHMALGHDPQGDAHTIWINGDELVGVADGRIRGSAEGF